MRDSDGERSDAAIIPGRPTGLRFAAGPALLPFEVAASVIHSLGITERLLEETVHTVRASRSVIEDLSVAYRAGHLDTLLRTLAGIQTSADNAMAFARMPIGAVQGVIPLADRFTRWRPDAAVRNIAPDDPEDSEDPSDLAEGPPSLPIDVPGVATVGGVARRIVALFPTARR